MRKSVFYVASVDPRTLWYILWGAMALVAVVNMLTWYPILSGNYGLLFSVLLAAIAAMQLARGVSFLPRKELALAAVVLFLFGAGQLDQWLHTTGPPSYNRSIDFSAYYVAGKLVSETPPAELYYQSLYPDGRMQLLVPAPFDNGWQKAAFRYGVSVSTPFIYPPLFAVLMKPFTYFSYGAAYVLWSGVTVLLTLASIWISLSLGGRRVGIKLALILMVGLFSYFPFFEELLLGQVGSLILFLCAAGIWLLSRNRMWLSALCIALATMIKLTPIIAIPLLALHRKWKWLAAYGCWMMGLLALSIWQAGWAAHAQFLHSVMPSISCGVPAMGNTSIVAYVQDLFLGYVPPMIGVPSAIPHLACAVSKAVSLALYGAMMLRFYLYRNEQNLVRHLVLLVLLILPISPISWWHHYTIALLAFVYLWCTMREARGDGLLLAATLAVGTDLTVYALFLSPNHMVELVLAAIVPCLILALIYFRIPGEDLGGSASAPEETVRLDATMPTGA